MIPDISIVIPTFNREDIIGRAISSIRHGATSPELIVVDDGSTDDTAGAARRAIAAAGFTRATVLRQENAGAGAARNHGAAVAQGDYIAFLDSDDQWLPWTLHYIQEALVEYGRPALVFAQTVYVSDGEPLETEELPPRSEYFTHFAEAAISGLIPQLGGGNTVIRRDVLENLGGFSPKMRCIQDLDLLLRTANNCGCVLIYDTPLVAVTVGRTDRLTGNFPCLRDGLHHIFAQDRRGAYPAPASTKARFLVKPVVYVIRIGFATGYPRQAYALYFWYLGKLLAGRDWHWLIRLPLTPLLHLVRPTNFPFRWRPARRR